MTVRVRIAPSPTGNLHIGTARTAVFNWLFARNQGGKFILRIEDTDEARSRQEYTDNIMSGLQWLGIDWDEGPFFQTQRLEHYQKAIQTLLDKGLAYPCYCTPEELEAMREEQKANKQAPRYDNRHRNLTQEQKQAFEKEGRKPVIRFKIEDDREIVWQDQIRGKVIWKGSDLGGDMVIARRDETGNAPFGQVLYNLAVVVDDIDMNITHVIRGEDHIANTAKQILLYEGLGATVPEFAHTPLILNQEGRKLSKRDGVTSIDDFRDMGFLPQAMGNYMSLLGWTPPDATQEIFTLVDASKTFSLERVNKAGAKFDWDKLDWINSQYLHKMPINELVSLLIPLWEKAGYLKSKSHGKKEITINDFNFTNPIFIIEFEVKNSGQKLFKDNYGKLQNNGRIVQRVDYSRLSFELKRLKLLGAKIVDLYPLNGKTDQDQVPQEIDLKWLESLTAMIAPSLTRLTDCVKESRLIFGENINHDAEALKQLQQEGVKEVLSSILEGIKGKTNLTHDEAQALINEVTKTHNVKKGLVMRSLRAGLMGELKGPDLIQSWLLLNQKGWDQIRLEKSLKQ